MGMFGSMVTIIFQSTFHAEMYKNDFFYFLKIILRSVYQNNPKHKKN